MSAIRNICTREYTQAEIDGWTQGKYPGHYVAAINANDFFVATSSERIVGFSEFNPHCAEIAAVYINADFVRQGIGTKLLQVAEDAAVNRDTDSVHLSATINAVPFYQSQGYVLQHWGAINLRSGIPLRCAFMMKVLQHRQAARLLRND
jgi:GNAT superfamily N-acetyltransferase